MKTKTIMVCAVDDPQWTQEAVHQACILARNIQAQVLVVKMLQVQHIAWLGTALGDDEYGRISLAHYRQTAEDYGVTLAIQTFQYYALADAFADAATYFDAAVVFATLPKNILAIWRKYQLKHLANRLKNQQRQLYTLEQALLTGEPQEMPLPG